MASAPASKQPELDDLEPVADETARQARRIVASYSLTPRSAACCWTCSGSDRKNRTPRTRNRRGPHGPHAVIGEETGV